MDSSGFCCPAAQLSSSRLPAKIRRSGQAGALLVPDAGFVLLSGVRGSISRATVSPIKVVFSGSASLRLIVVHGGGLHASKRTDAPYGPEKSYSKPKFGFAQEDHAHPSRLRGVARAGPVDRRLSRGLVRLPGPSLGSESQPHRPSSADLATVWKLAGVDRLWASPSSTGDACPAGGPRPSRQHQHSLKKPGAHESVPTTLLSLSDSGRGLSQASGVLGAQ